MDRATAPTYTPTSAAARVVLFVLLLALPIVVARAEVPLDPARKAALLGLAHVDGAELVPADLEGRAVVVAFFASWCPPCHPEFQHLAAAHGAFPRDRLTIVAVNVFEDWGGLGGADKLRSFLARHQPEFAVVRGDEDFRVLFGEVDRIPTLFVFAPDGPPVLHFVHEEGSSQQLVGREALFAAIEAAGG